MTLPVGQISLSEVNTELVISPSSTLITMNDAAVRTLAEVGGSGTTISMQNLQGKSFVFALTISSNTYNYNLATAAPGAGWPGSSAIQLTINPGVVVGSTSTGTFALQIPSALNPAPSITVINNGTVIGMGGGGGTGGSGFASPGFPAITGTPGAIGGNALFVGRPAIITNNGTFAGGGGGGGGGGGHPRPGIVVAPHRRGGGGGGGAGFNGGAGGGVITPLGSFVLATPGSSGTVPAGGAGGDGRGPPGPAPTYSGGSGGGQGASGSAGLTAGPISAGSGGGAGAYISGLPLATFPVTGTRLGPSS